MKKNGLNLTGLCIPHPGRDRFMRPYRGSRVIAAGDSSLSFAFLTDEVKNIFEGGFPT